MSEESMNNKKDKFKDIDGYVKWDHQIGGKHMVMYIEKNMHPLAAFEGSFNYAEHFKSMHYKQEKAKREQEIKKKEEANNAEEKQQDKKNETDNLAETVDK